MQNIKIHSIYAHSSLKPHLKNSYFYYNLVYRGYNLSTIFYLEGSGGQEIEFHEIELIILPNWSGDRKGPRFPQGARLG
jgi:hypothetical protein